MTKTDAEIFRSANLFIELHGDDAVTKARGMVRTMRERGDNNGADRWPLSSAMSTGGTLPIALCGLSVL